MRIILFSSFLITLFSAIVIPSTAQSLSWAGQLRGTETKDILAGAVDNAGNIYTVGTFESVMDVDPGPGVLNYNGGTFYRNDMFILKQSPDGDLLWVHQFGVNGYDAATDIVVSPSGDLYITGNFIGTVDFDPGPGVSNLTCTTFGGDIFILRLSSSGDFIWAKQISKTSGTGVELPQPYIAADGLGNVILAVNFNETRDFDPGPGIFTVDAVGSSDIVVCKLSPSGTFTWAKRIDGAGAEYSRGVMCDTDGNIFFGGTYTDIVDFDPGAGTFNLGTVGGVNGYIAKLSPNGTFVWAKNTEGETRVKSVYADDQNNYYAIGYVGIPSNCFFSKYSQDGNQQWIRYISGSAVVEGVDIAADHQQNVFITCFFGGTSDFDPGAGVTNLSGGSIDVAFAQFSSDGNLLWARRVGGNKPDKPNFIALDHSGENIYIGGKFSSTMDFDPGPGVSNLTSLGVDPYGDLFIAKYSKGNLISGKTFKDANGDGLQQSGEPKLSNVVVKATRGNFDYYAVSDSNGLYRITADTGNYSINLSLPLYYTSIIPSSHNAVFGALFGQYDTTNHFALTPAIIKDLRVHITNVNAVRPGFQTTYRLTYTNVGTDPISGNILLTHDNRLSFVDATPVPANYTSPVLRWDFLDLPPSMSQSVDIRLGLPFTVPLGTILKSHATANPISGDFEPTNNVDSLLHTVTGSYDPNDKKVNPNGAIAPTFVTSGQHFDYTIRFQNTGTDTAFTVVIKDTLSSNLDFNSFETLSASHRYSVNLKGNGIAEWTFANILLPDSNRNEVKSHGFVRYRLKPKNSLVAGDMVRNKAAIYFDFNLPVITNETVNTVTVITSVNPSAVIIESKVFPNPANSSLNIKAKGYFNFSVYDVVGKIITRSGKIFNQTVWEPINLAKGIYFIEIRTAKGKAVHKILVN